MSVSNIVSILFCAAVLVLSGCAATEGPMRPKKGFDISQSVLKATADCESQYPAVGKSWDPNTGYFIFRGNDAEKMRRCLIEKHGWFKLGPPEFSEGTMAPPR